jgi:hypothetical protein
VTKVRLFLEPDPTSVMGDSRALLSAITASTRPGAKPEADGTFVFRGVMAGAAMTLTVEGDVVTARTSQPALEPAEVRDVVVAVDRGASLDVLVVDPAGAPIGDAEVSVRAGANSPLIAQLMAARGKTGPDGVCRLRGLRTERTTVEATAKARLTATATIDLQAGGETRHLRLELGEGGVVTGIVTTAAGVPVAGHTSRTFRATTFRCSRPRITARRRTDGRRRQLGRAHRRRGALSADRPRRRGHVPRRRRASRPRPRVTRRECAWAIAT